MTIEIRTAQDEEIPEMFRVDARGFGVASTPEELERRRPALDPERFRLAVDAAQIVGVAGSFGLQVAFPGGRSVPMGGVTWVSVSATHRRQGMLRRLLDAVHADIDARGEPLAGLLASEGGIYERFGYGVATHQRRVTIDARAAQFRPEAVPPPGTVRFVDDDEARRLLPVIWERYRPRCPGETTRTDAWWTTVFMEQSRPVGDAGPVFRLAHRDGYATYRIRVDWNEGHPQHQLDVVELVAVTSQAHAALWHTLLAIDLVGTVSSRRVPLDDPLPFLLENPRVVRTRELNDGLWLRPHSPGQLLAARAYGVEDELVLEVHPSGDDSAPIRWYVTGGPKGADVARTPLEPDLVLGDAALGAILLGGVRPSLLARGGRISAPRRGALRRADAFFGASRLPFTQNPF